MFSYTFSCKINLAFFSLRLKVEKNLLTSAKNLDPACQMKYYASFAYAISFQIVTPSSDPSFHNLQEYFSLLTGAKDVRRRKCDYSPSVFLQILQIFLVGKIPIY